MFRLPVRPVVRSVPFACALAFAGVAGTAPMTGSDVPGAASGPTSLDALRWQRRLIVAFTSGPAADVELERTVAANACRLHERDTDVHRVTPDAVVPLSAGAVPLDGASREALSRLRGDADADVELVLIGKDGGVKRRAESVAALPAFLDAIDGMPMRRAERRRRPDDC